jgi:hypothetical protein
LDVKPRKAILFYFYVMKLLPIHKLTLHTHLSPAQCVEKLEQNTTAWSLNHMFKRDPKGKLFVGHVHAAGFELRHIIDYNNSFIPIAHGTLKPIDNGTEVLVHYKPHNTAIGFAYVLLALFLGLAGVLITPAFLNDDFDRAMLILPVSLTVVTTVVCVSVKAEYENSKQLLMQILKSPGK